MNKRLILFSFVFLFLASSFVFAEETQQEITIITTQHNMQQAIDENTRTVSYVFQEQGAIKIGDSNYWDAKEGSSLKTDDKGYLIEANLTASKETTWKFGNDTITVEAGTRVVYKDGKIEIFDKEDKKVNVELGEKAELKLSGGILSGKNFQVGDVKVQSGSLSLANGGYVLGKNSLADWKGLTLGNGQDLFLATSEEAYNSYSGSAIFPEDLRLRGKGESYGILFNEDNKWAKIQKGDLFLLKTTSADSNFYLENRNSEGIIPQIDINGNLEITQDSKIFTFAENKISLKKDSYPDLNNYLEYDIARSPKTELLSLEKLKLKEVDMIGYDNFFTSPLYINYGSEKMLISNLNQFKLFNGEKTLVSVDPLFGNSIYSKELATGLKENYLTFEDIALKYGVKIDSTGFSRKESYSESLENIYSNILDKALSNVQEDNLKNLKKIDMADSSLFVGGEYHSDSQTLDITISKFIKNKPNFITIPDSFGVISHELTHMSHDLIQGQQGTLLARGGEDYLKYIQLNKLDEESRNNNPEFQRLNALYGAKVPLSPDSEFSKSWESIAGGLNIYTIQKEELMFEEPFSVNSKSYKNGWVRLYGGRNLNEDVATFVEQIVGDPAFFKRNNLLQEENSVYLQKIKLLHNSGFISDKEYDSVLNPGKYGLE